MREARSTTRSRPLLFCYTKQGFSRRQDNSLWRVYVRFESAQGSVTEAFS